jgi:DNA-binding transcriptional ArsR family regulator
MGKHLLPRSDNDPEYENAVQTLDLTGEEADKLFDALSSETSRAVFEALYDEPRTPSDLAEELDTSLQNAHYHLEKLEAADLIEPVETVYSSRGVEIDVNAPTSEAVVLLTGERSRVDSLRRLLRRFVGGLGVLVVGSFLVQWWAETRHSGGAGGFESRSAGGGGEPTATATETATPTATPAPTRDSVLQSGDASSASADATSATLTPGYNATPGGPGTPDVLTFTPTPGAESVGAGLPPGALFFAGGLLVLSVAAAWMYLDPSSPAGVG